jgi:sigma-B regulation protein RsbU (phosphoserine phosphatase)
MTEPGARDTALAPFELIAEMTQDFASSLDIERSVGRALERIVEHLGAVAGSLWLLESGERELVCRASVGPHPITGQRLPVSEGVLGRSVRENVCQAVLDVSRDPHFAPSVDETSGLQTRSLLCAPMSATRAWRPPCSRRSGCEASSSSPPRSSAVCCRGLAGLRFRSSA